MYNNNDENNRYLRTKDEDSIVYVYLKTEILVLPKYFTHTTEMYTKQHEASEKLVQQM